MNFFANKADILIFGGAAGGGKTYALLLQALWHHDARGFNAVIFRKTSKQARNPGGLWQATHEIYHEFGGIAKETTLEWDFPSGARIGIGHMDHETDKYNWQGSEICLIGFDELTHFSWGQFMYLLSRNRSTCGVRPYIRATCNPDPDSWVRKYISWWIDEKTGYAIPERSGKMRWNITVNDEIVWADTEEELKDEHPGCHPKSVSFINSSVYDNKILLEKDPHYVANLYALPRYEREQLLFGNWNIRPASGNFFKREWFSVVEFLPKGLTFVRYWDRAATKKTDLNDPDYTVGLKLAKDVNGIFYICDIVRLQESPLNVQNAIKNSASQDGPSCRIGLEQDPGQAGVSEMDLLIRMLAGFAAKPYKVQVDKITRASPVSAQSEAGNIKVLRGNWNDDFFREIENFPDGTHDDIVDAFSGAYLMLTEKNYNISSLVNM
jgi:predicted phage terminase large subunit-like protein